MEPQGAAPSNTVSTRSRTLASRTASLAAGNTPAATVVPPEAAELTAADSAPTKPKKKTRGKAKEVPKAVYVSLLESLPLEIVLNILRQLNPHSLLSVLTLSRRWHYTVTTGQTMELEWHFFCNRAGVHQQVSGKSWYETWLSVIKRNCRNCRKSVTASYKVQSGEIVPLTRGMCAACNKVCDTYSLQQVDYFDDSDYDDSDDSLNFDRNDWISFERALDILGEKRLRGLSRGYYGDFRRSEVYYTAERVELGRLAEKAKKRRRIAHFDVKVASFTGDVTALKAAVIATRKAEYPASPKLASMYQAALGDLSGDLKKHFNAILAYYKSIKAMLETINAALEKAGLNQEEHVIPLDELVDKTKPRARKIWIDSLVSKTVSIKAYIEATRKKVTPAVQPETVQEETGEAPHAEAADEPGI